MPRARFFPLPSFGRRAVLASWPFWSSPARSRAGPPVADGFRPTLLHHHRLRSRSSRRVQQWHFQRRRQRAGNSARRHVLRPGLSGAGAGGDEHRSPLCRGGRCTSRPIAITTTPRDPSPTPPRCASSMRCCWRSACWRSPPPASRCTEASRYSGWPAGSRPSLS